MAKTPREKAELTAFQSRIKKLNEDHENRSIWDSIDRPIRPLVYELNRIGLMTKFSCCGFTYEDQEEPKTHSKNKAYVHIYSPPVGWPKGVEQDGNLRDQAFRNFFRMAEIAKTCGWHIYYFMGNIWDLSTKDHMKEFYEGKDGIEESIHQYEVFVVKIHHLAVHLKRLPTVFDPVPIVDGNSRYENIEEWMVKPKKSCYVNAAEVTD